MEAPESAENPSNSGGVASGAENLTQKPVEEESEDLLGDDWVDDEDGSS